MSAANLAHLLEKATKRLASHDVRYPISLNPETAQELGRLRQAAETAARAAALAEEYPAAEDKPKNGRRTLGARINAAQQAVADIDAQVAALLTEAESADDLVIVRMAFPSDALEHPDGPSGFYRQLWRQCKNAHTLATDKPDLSSEAVREAISYVGDLTMTELVQRDLAALSFAAVLSPAGEDLGMTWQQAKQGLLNSADVETIHGAVLDLYRDPSAIPFDPASFGSRTQS